MIALYHSIAIEKGRKQVIWQILRREKPNPQLNVTPRALPHVKLPLPQLRGHLNYAKSSESPPHTLTHARIPRLPHSTNFIRGKVCSLLERSSSSSLFTK